MSKTLAIGCIVLTLNPSPESTVYTQVRATKNRLVAWVPTHPVPTGHPSDGGDLLQVELFDHLKRHSQESSPPRSGANPRRFAALGNAHQDRSAPHLFFGGEVGQ
jgi:hypothetical protein